MSRRSDPPSALESAPTSDVIFPNDEYPPGFPCTSGCGKEFPTVVLQEIHTQHYCEGPYDEIEFWQGASVAAPQTPSTSSVSERDGTPQLPVSSGTSHLGPNTQSTPTDDAIAVAHNEDFKCPSCGKCLGERQSLRLHMVSHESGKFLCPVNRCRYCSAKSQAELDFHLREDHSVVTEQTEGERFACWYCGRNMNKRRRLLVHVRFHESGKFPCPIDNCSSSVLLSQDALEQHLSNKHTNIQICGSLL